MKDLQFTDDLVKKYAPGIVKEISEEEFTDLLNCLPPIYLKSINGEKKINSFAVSEAVNQDISVTFTICWREGEKHFRTIANVFKPDGKPMDYSYNYYEYTRECTATY